jgi:cyclopropane fatty-acyl-phospholipid synthase-like methyltransferase
LTFRANPDDRGYEDLFSDFDSPLKRQLRREAYGKDIGQHSWVSAEELERYAPQLALTSQGRLLDLGCGPCGPLAFIAGLLGCRITGVDLSANAITAGRVRVASLGMEDSVELHQRDLNAPLPFERDSFDAVISLDVILHLQDRSRVFRDVARLLSPQGRFLFTDAAVITGSISDEEVRLRAVHGYTQFVPAGLNERLLKDSGFRLLELTDRTESLINNARGRLTARLAHQSELKQVEGNEYFEQQRRYLETVIRLSERGSMSRVLYLAEASAF